MNKLNRAGWSLNELLVVIGIFAFCFVLITILYQSKFKNLVATVEKNFPTLKYTYEDMEKEMKDAAQNYMKEVHKNKLTDEKLIIPMQELKNEKFYTKTKDPKESNKDCSGYVLVTKKLVNLSYQPYIKCGTNYMTKGYK